MTLTFDILILKCIGVTYWTWPIFLLSTMTVTQKLFKILSGHGFCIKCYCDLDLLISKCIGVIYWPWPIFLSSTMTVTHKLFKILSGHGFWIKCLCDLDLWPIDLKLYKVYLLTKTNLPTNLFLYVFLRTWIMLKVMMNALFCFAVEFYYCEII